MADSREGEKEAAGEERKGRREERKLGEMSMCTRASRGCMVRPTSSVPRNMCAGTRTSCISLRRQRPLGGVGSSRHICHAREGIHPEFHDEAKVYCNGEEVFSVGGVSASYDVDIWSGNHPVFQDAGAANTLVDEGHVNKFKDKFGDMGDFGYACISINCVALMYYSLYQQNRMTDDNLVPYLLSHYYFDLALSPTNK